MNLEVVLPADVSSFACAWAAATDDGAGEASWNVVTAYVVMLATAVVRQRDPQATVRDLLVYLRHATLPQILEDGRGVAPQLVAALENFVEGLAPTVVIPTIYTELTRRCRVLQERSGGGWA